MKYIECKKKKNIQMQETCFINELLNKSKYNNHISLGLSIMVSFFFPL